MRPGTTQQGGASTAPSRPVYLIIALVVAWFLGLGTLQEGYVLASVAHDPLQADSLGTDPGIREAIATSISQASHVALPIGVAQVILGGLLVVTTAALLFGGRVPVAFALQVITANGVLALVSYFAAAPIREAMIQAALEAPEFKEQALELGQRNAETMYAWFKRVNLMLHIGALGLAALALTRPAVRRFLAYSNAPKQKS